MQVICVLLCRSRSIIHTGRLVMALLWKNKKERKLKKYRKIIIGAPRITAPCSTSKRFLFFIPVCQCIQWGVDNQRKKEEEENTQNNSK